jgi:hypothetical protein
MSNENRGLASADEETREKVSRKGGEASHGGGRGGGEDTGGSSERGFASMPEDERKRIASKGGQK